MNTVAYRLADAIVELDAQQVRYVLIPTRPVKKNVCLDDKCLYVIRQTVDDEDVYHLVVAGKMGREGLR